jgi:hypothetical protein
VQCVSLPHIFSVLTLNVLTCSTGENTENFLLMILTLGSEILSRELVTKTVFWLVIGFISLLQVLTTIIYYTVPDIYTTKHSTLIYSVQLHCSSRIYHTGTIQVSLNHFQYHSNTVHVKSSKHTSDLLQLRTSRCCLPPRTRSNWMRSLL